jgi:predicted Zn-ribbon and HTH transcriptional regulator
MAVGRQHKKAICSPTCWLAYDRHRHAVKSETATSLIGPLNPKACKACGGRFISWNGRPGFCSPECKSSAWRRGETFSARRQSGEIREKYRAAAAARALSTLLMPTHQHPAE